MSFHFFLLFLIYIFCFFFFFQAEDGIRDHCVTGVQTCALPICPRRRFFQQRSYRKKEPPPRSRPLRGVSAGICECSVRHPRREYVLFAPSMLSIPAEIRSARLNWHKKLEGASALRFAFHPDFAAMCLYETLGNGEAEAHSGCIGIHAHEIVKNLLMMLSSDAGSGVGHGHLNAVVPQQANAPALLHGRRLGDTAFPEVRLSTQRDESPRRRVLQRVIHQIGGGLLHFLIVETKDWQRGCKIGLEADAPAL